MAWVTVLARACLQTAVCLYREKPSVMIVSVPFYIKVLKTTPKLLEIVL